jgi:hypothetical protein
MLARISINAGFAHFFAGMYACHIARFRHGHDHRPLMAGSDFHFPGATL